MFTPVFFYAQCVSFSATFECRRSWSFIFNLYKPKIVTPLRYDKRTVDANFGFLAPFCFRVTKQTDGGQTEGRINGEDPPMQSFGYRVVKLPRTPYEALPWLLFIISKLLAISKFSAWKECVVIEKDFTACLSSIAETCRIVARWLSGNASTLPGDKASGPRKLRR